MRRPLYDKQGMSDGTTNFQFSISIILLIHALQEDLENGEDVAHCPSCSLVIRVIYNPDDIDNLIKSKVTNKAAVLLETN